MNDLKVVIDAGHGGTDQYMQDRFLQAGVDATLIRNSDETISPTERVRRILAAYGDNPNVVVISNHNNSSSNTSAEGTEIIYALRNTNELSKNILDELDKAGLPTRTAYQRRLPNNPSKDYYFIHRETGSTQPIIIEYGYMTTPQDLRRVQENYKKYVNAVVKGVLDTFDIGEEIMPDDTKNTYTVKAGDTLWSIARRFNTTVEDLMKYNNLSSDVITVGTVLTIPTTTDSSTNLNSSMYVVKAGDTLWNIAKRYNTTVENLMMMNNLTTDLITIGQRLMVPNKNVYVVKAGDTLWNIAKRNNTTVENLMMLNNLNTDLIKPGQIIKL